MKVHKYTSKTSRDALRQVREDLGPDAVILANRMVRGGVEILAMMATDVAPPTTAFDPLEVGDEDVVFPLTPAQVAAVSSSSTRREAFPPEEREVPLPGARQRPRLNLGPEPAVLRRRDDADVPSWQPAAAPARGTRDERPGSQAALASLAETHDPLMAALAEEVRSLGGLLAQRVSKPVETVQAVEATAPAPARGRSENEDWVRNVMGELRSMRMLIQDQMGTVPLNDGGRAAPGKMRAARTLSAAGFSAPLIRKVTSRLPDGISEVDALAFVRGAVAANLQVAASEAELLDAGGVFAIVGPTGAGKTTTVAKLAARFVVRHGAENLALLTTDGYRIGGQEQLRIYGKILGVAVYAVKDAEDLKRTLGELRGRKLVLIDTVGLSQRDRMVSEQLELFSGCGVAVKRLLLLNATCHGETLSDVVRAYKGDGLAGCILSKLDEALTLGSALDAAIRQRLRVFYAADGQRVPEDLHLANAAALVERALHGAPEQPGYGALDLDFPFEIPVAPPPGAHTAAMTAGGMAHG